MSVQRRVRSAQKPTRWDDNEFPYPNPDEWTSDDDIFTYLSDHAFSILEGPRARDAHFFDVFTSARGRVSLPLAYRFPLLLVGKCMWTALKWVMTIRTHREEWWQLWRLRILHLGKLCSKLFEDAQAAEGSSEWNRHWRCKPFDRMLVRLRDDHILTDPQIVHKYWRKHGEDYIAANRNIINVDGASLMAFQSFIVSYPVRMESRHGKRYSRSSCKISLNRERETRWYHFQRIYGWIAMFRRVLELAVGKIRAGAGGYPPSRS